MMHTMLYYLAIQSQWPKEVVFWKNISSFLAIGGAIILWLSLIFLSIIAKKYEIVLRKKTDWQFMIIAPSGILIFAIIKMYAAVVKGFLKMTDIQSWIAYGLFFLSGLLSLIATFRFYNVVKPKKG
ncbi:MAG: hypothetical protein E3J78_03030 [Candidatus Cloacimonadota bacterium]|nr:MAG: hypothetical protein E3J78_03030 [Candidatus Cloacimonadota bacterium]